MKTLIQAVITLFVLTFITTSLQAQSTFVLADSSTMSITGTSTLHDWESRVTEFSANIKANIASETPSFQEFSLTVPVKSIKSEKSKMEKKTYEALKEKDHPNITFDLLNVTSVEDDTVTAAGNLTIAGTTKPITIKAAYTTPNETKQNLQLKGAYSLKMTNYNVEPPSVMFGTIKSGDEITIQYNFYLTSNNL